MGRQLVLTLVSDPVTVDTVVRFVQKVLQVCLSLTCHCLSPTCHCLFTAFLRPVTAFSLPFHCLSLTFSRPCSLPFIVVLQDDAINASVLALVLRIVEDERTIVRVVELLRYGIGSSLPFIDLPLRFPDRPLPFLDLPLRFPDNPLPFLDLPLLFPDNPLPFLDLPLPVDCEHGVTVQASACHPRDQGGACGDPGRGAFPRPFTAFPLPFTAFPLPFTGCSLRFHCLRLSFDACSPPFHSISPPFHRLFTAFPGLGDGGSGRAGGRDCVRPALKNALCSAGWSNCFQ